MTSTTTTTLDKFFREVGVGEIAQTQLHVKVLQVEEEETSYNETLKKQVRRLRAKIVDSSAAAQLVVHNENLFDIVKKCVGRGIRIRAPKNAENKTVIVGTKADIMRVRTPDEIPDIVMAQAEHVYDIPVSTIKDVLASPIVRKKLYAVKGRVIQRNDVKSNEHTGSKWRDLMVEDDTGTIKVRLWGEASSSPVKCGADVKISHATYDQWRDEFKLNLNDPAKIAMCEEAEKNQDITIHGIRESNETRLVLAITVDDDIPDKMLSYEISYETMFDYYRFVRTGNDENDRNAIDDSLLDQAPLSVSIKVLNTIILQIGGDE